MGSYRSDRSVGSMRGSRRASPNGSRTRPGPPVALGRHPAPPCALGPPLLGPRRRQELLPLVAEQDVEELVVPPGRVVGSGDLDPAGDGVGALAGAVGRLPAEALV